MFQTTNQKLMCKSPTNITTMRLGPHTALQAKDTLSSSRAQPSKALPGLRESWENSQKHGNFMGSDGTCQMFNDGTCRILMELMEEKNSSDGKMWEVDGFTT